MALDEIIGEEQALHEHANKTVLDKLTAPAGKLLYDGNAVAPALPIKVPNVVLDKDNWTQGVTYKEYEYTHNSVTSASWVDMVVHNSSSAIAEAAVMMPQVDEGTGTITIYAVNVPSDDITVDFKITLCDVES